ncbi:MAG: PP2C family protein-serine/threonine phosphatase [Bacteroidota bacterium]|nr:PP2C family protein-serine/threonine phosphatase [Bacteroidota bacterium]
MTQRTLYKTIEKVASAEFTTDEDMLIAVLKEIVTHNDISIIGGRIWKLQPEERSYELIYEEGAVDLVGVGFKITIDDYDLIEKLAKRRTVLADETNTILRSKGIMKYSATGIGSTTRIGSLDCYEYIMALNASETDPEFPYALNIAGQAVTHMLAKRRSEAEKRTLLTELEHAAALQRQILPEHEQQFGRYELYGISIPDRTVGGDFFNYYTFPSDSGRLGVAIGDAASKGLAAAVQALFVAGALMMSVEYESKISTAIRRINTINMRMFPNDRILTLFYCELFDVGEGLLLYANAGHSRPIHYHASDGHCTMLRSTGPIIGLLKDAVFHVSSDTLKPDDLLVLYTDGITEADDGNEEYGERRLVEFIRTHASLAPKDLCREILQDVQTFNAAGKYSDDKTLVVVKRIR